MAYRVAKVKRSKGPQFKIRYEWFEAGERKSRDVPRDEWAALGFSASMDLVQVNKHKDSLNAAEHLTRHDERRNKIQLRIKEQGLAQLAYLPEVLLTEYEARLFGRRLTSKKLHIYWSTAKSILCELRLDPSEWADNAGRFYDLFSERHYSVSYVRTLIPMLNKWGMFLSKKTQKYFEPIPVPRGRERELIADANHDATGAGNKASDPLTPTMLESQRSALKEEHYNWLFLTVWLGLRPSEVDGMKDVKNYRIEKVAGTPVLSVYQSKLVSVPRDKRWKRIPCFIKEQEEALRIIEKGNFKRPLSKSVAGWWNEKVGLYGGRKNFVDLMQSYNQSLEDISQWLGHTTIERTWKSYKDKQTVRFKPAA